jgi:hypothetical protein
MRVRGVLMRAIRGVSAAMLIGLMSACAASEHASQAAVGEVLNAWPQAGIANVSELETYLRQGATPVELEPLEPQRGCTPALCGPDQIEHFEEPIPADCTPMRCSLRVDAIEWDGDLQALRVVGGESIELANAGIGPALDLAQEPFAAARVHVAGRVWGLCIEAVHNGVGLSGRSQRWVTLLLVPYHDSAPTGSASRLTGYWASCAALQASDSPDVIKLPLVEPAGEAVDGLVLSRYRCNAGSCERVLAGPLERLQVDDAGVLRRSD